MSLEDLKAWYKQPMHDLMNRADRARQMHFGQKVTYSRNYSLAVSNHCRNNCGYCAFRARTPGVSPKLLMPVDIEAGLTRARDSRCWEVLFITGEGGSTDPEIDAFLKTSGWKCIEEYYSWALSAAISKGLLPHSNFGLVSRAWLAHFKQLNASMGLMLETVSTSLCDRGMPHEFSPGKHPSLRLQFLEWAGELQIPITTGLLIGVGETVSSRLESLLAIWHLHQRFGHIQEVILQNFVPHQGTPLENYPPPPTEDLLRLVAVSRLLFGKSVSIQVAPNLNPASILDLVHAGANDLGGISPVTIDHVNPKEPWPSAEHLAKILSEDGIDLVPRLPVYDAFISDKFLSPAILRNITRIQESMRDGF
ncbi:MAG: 7,8-didemethyl-8-hydroxy-5-deazariboflavin synthase subunit CofG [Candidatus Sigynarchaeota archaeon]